MKSKIFLPAILITLLGITFSSCFKDLDLDPVYGLNSTAVYEDPENYIHVLAKLYAGLAITGNEGPAGAPDIEGIDEGFSSYIRVLWNMQELPTDEAVCGWSDPGIPEMHVIQWNGSNSFVAAMYSRIYFIVALANEFINQSSDENMNARGFSTADQDKIRSYVLEARFLRALSYYHAIDLFGNVTFVNEEDPTGSFFYPEQINRADLFNYVEDELLAIESSLPAPKANEYARADQAAVWSLLAKMYLNAEVYTGTDRYTDCANYCDKVINSGAYSLQEDYTHLFLADNHLSGEIIFPVAFDGLRTQTYGGTTFLTHAPVGGTMVAADFGIGAGWAGLRTTSAWVDKFPDSTADERYLVHTDDQSLEIESITDFKQGYGITKWRNITSLGEVGSDPTNFVDIDYPMFRLADVYLMYAEAAVRGGGDVGQGLTLFNAIRERAFNDASHNLGAITLDDIIDERSRELYWEATRRTDLIRFDLFTTDTYLWPFKGGVPEGTEVPGFYNLFPIPDVERVANPNLIQNTGY